MRKTILAAAFMAVAMVSCQDKTKEKVEDATEAVGTEAEQKVDTINKKVDNVVDSTKAQADKALEKTGKEMEKAGKKVEEAAKK